MSSGVLGVVGDRLRGRFELDPWGGDPQLVEAIDPVVGLVWRVAAAGTEHVPAEGPVVLVTNRRVGVAEPFVVGRAVRKACGRRVRFLGVPDVAVVGPALRRVGGAIHHPDELAALLRAAHVVALPLGHTWRKPLRAGSLDAGSLVPALELGAVVLPVAVIGGEISGRWRVVVGAPIEHPATRTPLGLAQMADATRAGVQALLDEEFPPRWLLG